MKLLLTSAGIQNKSIENELVRLFGRPFTEAKIIFIITPAMVKEGDKWWLINDLVNLKNLKPASLDIIDIVAIPKEDSYRRLKEADIIVGGGGNTFHFMECIKNIGLDKDFKDIIKDKVYMGIGAGSMITTKELSAEIDRGLYGEIAGRNIKYTGLNFVNIFILPHYDSEWFPDLKEERIGEILKNLDVPVYLLDDNSAVVVEDDKISIVSEGEYKVFNN